MKPLFDFFLRTTNKLEILVHNQGNETYEIKLINYKDTLPVDIQLDGSTKRMEINQNGLKVTAKTWPVIDPKGFYLKRVILE